MIRIKNKRKDVYNEYNNIKINKYIKWYTKLNNIKYETATHKTKVKMKLKQKAIVLSEATSIDASSYERFGEIIMLMIKNILKKPQFSGYTYRDDFYSDAIYKIIKYLHNFDHTMISKITGQPVNSFAYISQIIHNAIIFIINTKKKENDKLKLHVGMEAVNHNYKLKDGITNNHSTYQLKDNMYEDVLIECLDGTTLYDYIVEYDIDDDRYLTFIYPKNYTISFDEYDMLKEILKCKINIVRDRNE